MTQHEIERNITGNNGDADLVVAAAATTNIEESKF